MICVPFLYRFHESPRFLATNRGKYSKARNILNNIASVNRHQQFSEMLEGEKVIGYQEDMNTSNLPSESTQSSRKYSFIPISKGIVSVTEAELKNFKKYSYLDLCTLQSVRGDYGIIFLLFFILFFADFLQGTSPLDISNNEYIDYVIMRLVEVIGCICAGLSLYKIGRQISLLISFGITGIALLISLAFMHNKCEDNRFCEVNVYALQFFLVLSKFSLAGVKVLLYTTTLERFPTSIRSLTLGCLGIALLIVSLIYPGTLSFFEKSETSPILGAGIMMLFGAIFSCTLTENRNKCLEDYVEEEKEEMKNPVDISSLDIQSHEINTLNPNDNFQPLAEEKELDQ